MSLDSIKWLPVVGFEDRYEVSDDGRVRGHRGELSIQTDDVGRQWVALWHEGRMSSHRVHRLMAFAFLGHPEPGQTDVCHNDGNPARNVLANLRWDTHAANMLDIRRHGTARNQNSGATHCKRGHGFTEANTYVSSSGTRTCKECRRDRGRRYEQNKRKVTADVS